MKIIFFEATEEEKQFLSNLSPENDCVFYEETLTEQNVDLAKDAEAISIFVNSVLSEKVIEGIPNLKFISTRSTGFDHIDIEFAKKRGIKVSNVPSYGSRTVAEYTFALILNLSRKVGDASLQIKQNGDFDISSFRGFDLYEKTLGVIGTGKIGKNVIKIARGFGMNVLAFDKFHDDKFAAENNVKYLPLEEVLSLSDVVTIHTLYNKDTYHLLNKENMKLMKKGAYLINTARGEIVETDALVWALQEKILAGAGLDVLEGERALKEGTEAVMDEGRKDQNFKTLLEDHILMDMPNVTVTPHIAFSSREAEAEILKTTIENIIAYNIGAPQNLVQKV
ncbi:MAG: NAD(P)-dependent oxidoreductase [Candidatus Paceibacterota bacterium]|jgi:D-lactate dehydrogenase